MSQATDAATLEKILAGAAAAARPAAAAPPADRARWLVAAADALDAAADDLVPLAHRETHLPATPRLAGELKRTTFQLRLFAEVLTDGEYLGATVDHADPDWPMGPRPDIRRVKAAIGPVLVFAASNFPFAFSVAGGDTASALAAGCPVILTAHPGHPELSALTGRGVTEALRGAGAPDGTFAVVFGVDTGVTALRDERIRAGAFTGSIPAGRALADIAAARPVPIPFYGELGSINPVFATPSAVADHGAEIATGYAGSFTLGVGQFCTTPGLLFLPAGHGLDDALTEAVSAAAGGRMLTGSGHSGYRDRRREILRTDGVRVLAEGAVGDDLAATPTLVAADVPTLLAHRKELLEEAFGPMTLDVGYTGVDELPAVARELAGALASAVHAGPGDGPELTPLVDVLRKQTNQQQFNGWPTGVAVTPAMHHG